MSQSVIYIMNLLLMENFNSFLVVSSNSEESSLYHTQYSAFGGGASLYSIVLYIKIIAIPTVHPYF